MGIYIKLDCPWWKGISFKTFINIKNVLIYTATYIDIKYRFSYYLFNDTRLILKILELIFVLEYKNANYKHSGN